MRGQVPAVQRHMIFDMAVFDSRVLRDVPRAGFRSLHSLVHHDPHSLQEFSTWPRRYSARTGIIP